MSRFTFVEPAACGSPEVEVYVTNPDELLVTLTVNDHGDSVSVSYWQLERIVRNVRATFASQLDREAADQP